MMTNEATLRWAESAGDFWQMLSHMSVQLRGNIGRQSQKYTCPTPTLLETLI